MNLTKEQIEKMEAGREMDALIAEKVLGLSDWHIRHSDEDGDGNLYFCEIKDELPHYSTDIAAAWQVIEKIKSKQKCLFTIQRGVLAFAGEPKDRNPEDYHWWEVGWMNQVVYTDWGQLVHAYRFDLSVQAETLPLAICRCALLTTL
jgi:hypothetical protein